MALDPLIARGVQPIEIGNTLMRIGAMQQRDESLAQDAKYQNALMQDRQEMRAQQQTALAEAQAQEQRKREAAYKYALIAKGDMGALQEAVAGISQHHPGFVEAFQRDPEQARAAILSGMQSEFGFAAPEKPPGPIQFKRTPWGGQYAEQDGQRVPGLEWNPPAPQQYGPATYSNVTVMENGKPVVYAVNTRNPSERVRVGDAVANEAESVDVKAQVERAKREQAWNLYSTARDGLVSGLEGATTNPLVGRLPAVTARQQVAEGSVAAMAPVLKQLFRVAGEGVFTDRDQQLLLDMVPKRTDLPAARAEKIANIDRIVKAKLGLDSAQPEAAEGGLTPEEQAELQQLRQRFGR